MTVADSFNMKQRGEFHRSPADILNQSERELLNPQTVKIKLVTMF